MNFNKEEIVEVVFILGDYGTNSLSAFGIYSETYTNRKHHNKRALKEIFIENGGVKHKKKHPCTPTVLNQPTQLNGLGTSIEYSRS